MPERSTAREKGPDAWGSAISCHAGCCRAFAVPVTGADIVAIKRRLGLPFDDFIRRLPDHAGSPGERGRAALSFEDTPATPYVICLSHTRSEFHAELHKCRFLIECAPDEEFPVGARPLRDLWRAAFRLPGVSHEIQRDQRPGSRRDIPERLRQNANPAYTLCPRPWQPEDVDPIQAVQDLAVLKYELAFFWQVADLWNRSPESWRAFPQFLEIVYSKRVRREEPAPAAQDDQPATLPLRNSARTTGIIQAPRPDLPRPRDRPSR